MALVDVGVPTWRRLRTATASLFALSGFVFGSWAARIPDVGEQVGAGHSGLGVALLCLSLGALATMQLTGALCVRLGPGLVAVAAAFALGATTVLPAVASSVPELAAALVVFGAATGAVNVAANSLGVQVEQRAGRPMLPQLHAGFSFGGLAGALAGGLAGSAFDVAPHLLAVGVAGLLLTVALAPVLSGNLPARPALRRPGRLWTLRAVARRADGAPDVPRGPLVLLGAMAGATAFGEGALADWGALHLRETLHATPALAAAGYAAFSLAMGIARLSGGRLVDRFGDTRVLVGGAAVAAAGVLAVAFSTGVPVALLGFGLVGVGLANIFPLAIARAGALGGAAGVGTASTVGYAGLLAGPPLVGFLAERAGIPAALSTISVLAAVAGLLAVATDRHASAATLRAWRGAASLGPALLRVQALVDRGTHAARRSAADLALLVPADGERPAPRRPASDLDILLG